MVKMSFHNQQLANNMSIGSNLKQARKLRELSQEQLATMADISIGHISKIERDKVDPSVSTIKELAKALNCSTDELIFDESERGPSDDMKLLFEAVNELPKEKKEVVEELIEAIVMKSDAEKWLKKSSYELAAEGVKRQIKEQGLAAETCKECGATMKNEEPTKEQLQNGIFSIKRCPKCEWTHVMTGDIKL